MLKANYWLNALGISSMLCVIGYVFQSELKEVLLVLTLVITFSLPLCIPGLPEFIYQATCIVVTFPLLLAIGGLIGYLKDLFFTKFPCPL